MIRIHFYDTQEKAAEGLTQRLFKHFETTRFIAPPRRSVNDYARQNRFSLALSGGATGAKIFSHWKEKHLNNPHWQETDYYWIDERCVPHESNESNYGTAYRLFFRHSRVATARIHPIRYSQTPETEAERYGRQLPQSKGLFYDPTRYYTGNQPCVIPCYSPFHCAILGVGEDRHIASLFPDTTETTDSAAYRVTRHTPSGKNRITATMNTIEKIPRILVALLGKSKAGIIEDLYYRRNTGLPAIKILLNHPDIHIFTDNRDMEQIIYRDCK